MNSAPAVQYPVGRSTFQGYFLLFSSVVALLVAGLWLSTDVAMGAPQITFFIVLVIVFWLAGHAWRRTEVGLLAWGGESWSWSKGLLSINGRLSVHFDVQFLMILALQPEKGPTVWLWAERASDAVRWRALRRAVYADEIPGSVVDPSHRSDKSEALF